MGIPSGLLTTLRATWAASVLSVPDRCRLQLGPAGGHGLGSPPLARVAAQGLPDGRGLPVALAFASPKAANRHYLDLASGVMITRVSLNESLACLTLVRSTT